MRVLLLLLELLLESTLQGSLPALGSASVAPLSSVPTYVHTARPRGSNTLRVMVPPGEVFRFGRPSASQPKVVSS